jgi:hypothetical protein
MDRLDASCWNHQPTRIGWKGFNRSVHYRLYIALHRSYPFPYRCKNTPVLSTVFYVWFVEAGKEEDFQNETLRVKDGAR